ncbi:MAG: 50S ribosomal protein L10 [Candidatus Marinimicrobia bacterium]|nr:50S ribosomal protein L10 [Candidatus Neomarinimicrobiota bacterium]
MPTKEKIAKVEEIAKYIKDSKAIYFSDCIGLNVEQINDLRSTMFDNNIKMQVAKNTLIKLSLEKAGYDFDSEEILTGPTALIYGIEDSVTPAKILMDFKKAHKEVGKPEMKALIFEGELFGKEKIDQIAVLPSKNELFGKLLSGLSYPISHLLGDLQSSMQKIVGVLQSLKDKKDN